jgi:molecular chaperone DnaJ
LATEPDYYRVLGVPETASHDELQEAYRSLARAYHPDRSGGDTAGRFREVQEAWEVLGNPARRRVYDARRWQARHRGRPRPTFPQPAATPSRPHPSPPGRGETLRLQLRMTPAEAVNGGTIAVDLPAWQPCGTCGNRGEFLGLACPVCRGRGRVLTQERFSLNVPPGLEDGQMVELRLNDLPHLLHRRLLLLVRVG